MTTLGFWDTGLVVRVTYVALPAWRGEPKGPSDSGGLFEPIARDGLE